MGLRFSVGLEKAAAHEDAPVPAILQALRRGTSEFEGEHFVPVELLDGFSMLFVEATPLLYAPGTGVHAHDYFVGTLLRDHEDHYVGAGGWWVDPGKFIRLGRGTLANVDQIGKVAVMPGGTHVAILANGQKLPVSRIQSRVLRDRLLKL